MTALAWKQSGSWWSKRTIRAESSPSSPERRWPRRMTWRWPRWPRLRSARSTAPQRCSPRPYTPGWPRARRRQIRRAAAMAERPDQRYPLHWPAGWPRTPGHLRAHSPFKGQTTDRAFRDLVDELGRLGARRIIISSNLKLRQDGMPYSQQPRNDDEGIAVYFVRKRSEEHTSELQSQSNLVCRLLLEKK